jgi:alpha-glucosidase
MPDPSTYTFAGNVEAVDEIHGGVILTTAEGACEIRAFQDGIFRVRYTRKRQDLDEPPFSYAVPEEVLIDEAVSVESYPAEILIGTDAHIVRVNLEPLRVSFGEEGSSVDSFGMAHAASHVAVWKEKPASERYFGLGEKAWPLERTGKAFVNWNTDFPGYDKRVDPLYKTFPFYLALRPGNESLNAHGIFFDNSYRSTFDFGAAAANHVSFGAEGGELRYYFLPGPRPEDVIRRFSMLTGRMPLPARWTLGYHQCRWSYFPEATVRSIVQQFRDRSIPLDAIHLDIHYMDGYRVFTWDRSRFPDPAAMIRDLKDKGVRTVVIVDPGIKVDESYDACEEGIEAGHFVTYPDHTPYTGSVWPGDCHFPDFTSEAARRWFGDRTAAFAEVGIAGIWTDMNEPSVSGGETLPSITRHSMEGRGGTHLEAHNLYGMQMARSVAEGLARRRPDERPFVITRAAFAGVQRHAITWTGDCRASWEHLRMAPSMLLSLGLCGVPGSGSDIGGFMGTASAELFVRWMQLGAVSPFFRTHAEQDAPMKEPWSYGPVIEGHIRRAIELRYRLLPYLYSLFDEHRQTGLPQLRAMLLHDADPDESLAIDDQFFVGHDLIAAPVLDEGRMARKVFFPTDGWYDFYSRRRYDRGWHLVSAPLDHLPLFVRGGAVLPLGPVIQHTDEPFDSLDLVVFRGTGESTLYEDDGISMKHGEGSFRRTLFSQKVEDGNHLLSVSREGPYQSPVREYRLLLRGWDSRLKVSLEDRYLDVHQSDEPSTAMVMIDNDFSRIHISQS